MADRRRRLGKRTAAALAAAAVLIAGAATPAAAAGDGEAYRRVLAERAPAVVTIRYVLNIELGGAMGGAMGGQGQEAEGEVNGVVVDPGGLVVCSNTLLGGFASLIGKLMGGDTDFQVTATPTELEVLIGDATEGLPARLVARDSDLDLAWIQIEKPPADLAAVDLSAGVGARIGEPFLVVRRMDKVFARAPALLEGRIGGEVTKPRRLWIPATSQFGGHGLPAFDAQGGLLGVTVIQFPDAEDVGAGGPMAMMTQSTRLEQMLSAVILPAAEVARATALAREMAARQPAETEAGAGADGGEPGEAEAGEDRDEDGEPETDDAETAPSSGDAEPLDADPGSGEPEPGDSDPGDPDSELGGFEPAGTEPEPAEPGR